MTDSHKVLNEFIRQKAGRGRGTAVTEGQLTGNEMNDLIRGKSIEEILAARKKRTELTTRETVKAIELMESEHVSWTEAKNRVIDQADGSDNKLNMNVLIRAARGQTFEEIKKAGEK